MLVVGLDPDSARQLGLPERISAWPRTVHARLIERLAAAGASTIVFVFHENPEIAAALPGELFSVDPVDCIADGPLACCDSKRGVMMLSATYDGQNGWVQMGELCKAPEIEALDFLPVPE